MLLTLPFEMSARVAAAPSFLMLREGKSFAAFEVTEPVRAEIPSVGLAQPHDAITPDASRRSGNAA